MNPTQALILCADLSRRADPTRSVCHMCIERRGDVVTIMATDSHLVFRFDFRCADFPADHWIRAVSGAWSAPGQAFPTWGARHWAVMLDGGVMRCEASTKGGKVCRKQPDPIDLIPDVVPTLVLWDQVTQQSDQIKIDVSNGVLADCVEILDGDAIVHMSANGDVMTITAGRTSWDHRWQAPALITAPEFSCRAVRASLLWEALDVCSPVHMLLSASDVNAPVIFTSPEHTAIVMPMKM